MSAHTIEEVRREADDRFAEHWQQLFDDAVELMVDAQSGRDLTPLEESGADTAESGYLMGVVHACLTLLGPDGYQEAAGIVSAKIEAFEQEMMRECMVDFSMDPRNV